MGLGHGRPSTIEPQPGQASQTKWGRTTRPLPSAQRGRRPGACGRDTACPAYHRTAPRWRSTPAPGPCSGTGPSRTSTRESPINCAYRIAKVPPRRHPWPTTTGQPTRQLDRLHDARHPPAIPLGAYMAKRFNADRPHQTDAACRPPAPGTTTSGPYVEPNLAQLPDEAAALYGPSLPARPCRYCTGAAEITAPASDSSRAR